MKNGRQENDQGILLEIIQENNIEEEIKFTCNHSDIVGQDEGLLAVLKGSVPFMFWQ